MLGGVIGAVTVGFQEMRVHSVVGISVDEFVQVFFDDRAVIKDYRNASGRIREGNQRVSGPTKNALPLFGQGAFFVWSYALEGETIDTCCLIRV
ncbi:unannotated protein [freshwater metagenome]|uniref:Unannotated protein n=1 Tax=freshwater metagenome TaxID=449393 RepID=A0A6J6BGH1_9ZZZZ